MLHNVMVQFCVSSSTNLDIAKEDLDTKKWWGSYSVKKLDTTVSHVRLNWFGMVLAQFARFFFQRNRFIGWLGQGQVISLKKVENNSVENRIFSILTDKIKIADDNRKNVEKPAEVEQSPNESIQPRNPPVTHQEPTLSAKIVVDSPLENPAAVLPEQLVSIASAPTSFEGVTVDKPDVTPSQISILRDLNTNFRPLARFFTEQHLVLKKKGKKGVQQTFQAIFDKAEKEKQKDAIAQVKALTTHLCKRYNLDFQNDGWHGYTSLGRVIWQDEEFIRLITKNPFILVALVLGDQNLSEGSLGGILLAGPGRQELAYLATVAPNWIKAPQTFTWKLNVMNPHNMPLQETPFHPTLEYLNHFKEMLVGISQTLALAESIEKDSFDASMTWVESASVIELLDKYKQCVTDTKLAQEITYSTAGDSTLPWNMAQQCFEVMYTYREIYEHHKSDSTSMGYGLVSHALDARHLAAALYFINKKETLKEESNWSAMYHKNYQGSLGVGITNFTSMIERMKSDTASPEDQELFKIRLQQLLKLVISKAKEKRIADFMMPFGVC